MTTAATDLRGQSEDKRFKAEQRCTWDDLAHEMTVWWPAFESIMAPVTKVMLACAALPSGARVVDVASGFGEPALTAARAVGAGGHVVATDLSASMLEVGRERAAATRLSNLSFVQMDAEEPALPEASFDVVFSRLGLMFLPNLDLALTRLTRLLVPGGRMVAAVWGTPSANLWLVLAQRTLSEYLGLAPPAPTAPTLFDLAAPGKTDGALARAGLDHVRSDIVSLDCRWASPECYSDYHRSSPMRRLLRHQHPVRRAEAWRAVADAARRLWGSGPLRLTGEIVVVSGIRPRRSDRLAVEHKQARDLALVGRPARRPGRYVQRA